MSPLIDRFRRPLALVPFLVVFAEIASAQLAFESLPFVPASGRATASAVVADFDSDRRNDVAVIDLFRGRLSIFLATRNGGFALAEQRDTPS
jgi:hypothetical protein